MDFLIFLGAFISLFLMSRLFTIQLGQALVGLTRSQSVSIHVLALFFFPGVMIHELGHFFMASILFVPTGEIEFLPKMQTGGVKLGSVAIGRTDPLRRLLIGVAPVLGGIGILFLASYYLTPLLPLSWKTILFAYILFEIGNTMFSSEKDLEGAALFLAFVGFIFLCLFIIGARIPESVWGWIFGLASSPVFLQMGIWLGASCVLNSILWAVLKIIFRRTW